MPRYHDYLKTYSPIGVKPDFTESIIRTNTKLTEVIESAEYKEKLGQLNLEIENKLLFLNKVLAGEQIGLSEERKAFFPLIEDEESKATSQTIGAIDSITIKLSKARQKDKFIIVPGEAENDKLLEEQINICWEKAKEFCKKHIRKISPYHEVIISFDGNLGVYRGESLGAALTIAMIEELLRYYNFPTVLEPISNVTFTGGVNENGEIKPVKKEIIQKKAEIVFYSNCEVFAVPKEDESYAVEKIKELKQKYPNRKIETVGVKTLNEILLRRDLVEIKKQKLIVRTSKFVKKNWVSAVITVLLAVPFGYLYVMDWDDNPALLSVSSNTLFVKNKNGRLLWTKKVHLVSDSAVTQIEVSFRHKIIDINDDGLNEIVICDEIIEQSDHKKEEGRIACFDHSGGLLWKYNFTDTASSFRDTIFSPYVSKVFDTVTINNVKQIICSANSVNSYAGVIFKLAAEDGERMEGTVWNAGHIIDGLIEDINNDGKKELLFTMFNNSYNKTGIAVLELNQLEGMLPGTREYWLFNKKEAESLLYLLVANTDFNKHLKLSRNVPMAGYLVISESENAIIWNTGEGEDSVTGGVCYKLSFDLKNINIIVASNFASRRDSLVIKGILKYPLTDTKEYRELLKSQIIYLHNGKWVKREELE